MWMNAVLCQVTVTDGIKAVTGMKFPENLHRIVSG